MATMNISVPDEMKEWVEGQCEDGSFGNSSDVMRDLIRRGQRREAAIANINRLIQEGIDSGPAQPFDHEEFLARMRAKHGTPDDV